MPDDPRPAPTARRAFLRLVALAPVAAAGCATVKPLAAPAAASAAAPAGSAPAAPADSASDALAPLRSFPLALEIESAFVFRAAVPPGGE